MPRPAGDRRVSKPTRRRSPDADGDLAFVVVHETGRGTVAWLRGDIDVSTAPELLRHLIETLDLPLDRLVLDLAEVRDVDHHGVAALQVARKRARMRGVELAFDGITDEALRAELA
jgi:anti-anti-sigma regulatory factor